jgi:hypothetical protein
MTMASTTDARTGTPHLASLTGTVIGDVESSGALTRIDASWVTDIEHVHVKDDPRAWSPNLKVSRFLRLDVISRGAYHVLIIPSADNDSDFCLFCLGM